MKKYIVTCTIIYIFFSAYIIVNLNFNTTYVSAYPHSDIELMSKTSGKKIFINQYGKWEKIYIKGVDIGAGKPGAFPGDFAISRKEYLNWFNQIVKMNANTIRVYTILSPDFYEALYDYNNSHIKKLYLIQGVWVNENDILAEEDAFSPVLIDQFKQDTRKTIDMLHGNITIDPVRGEASGTYSKDVSKWVIGYILGIEWDGDFVKNTNERHPEMTSYNGRYLKTFNASPFETFLSEVGDEAVTYETDKYKQQRMVAFSNWPTTDPLTHSNEEDSVTTAQVDVENIQATDLFYSGQFASYHVYPYYPDFFDFQEEYLKPSSNGEINSYRAYLNKLNAYHTMPVIISEYGVPSSRGAARIQTQNGYNQGNLTEKKQGEILVDLTNIIHDTGCAGGLVFSWQDEWFKRTWNTMDFSLPDYRAYWSDYETNEQFFGLLTFDPGSRKSVSYADGDISEWKNKDIIIKNNDMTLSMKSDEKFIYFMIHQPKFDINQDKILIPIDITQKSGIEESVKYHAKFESPTDFLIYLDGKEHSTLLVHDYYDAFTFHYSKFLFNIDPYSKSLKKESGDFVGSYLAMRPPKLVEATGQYSAVSYFDSGHLTYGNGNPITSHFNSLADFYVKGDNIEIKIPWGLLNIMDPSSKKVMDDFYTLKKISPQSFDKIYVGVSTVDSDSKIKMYPYEYEPWEEPTYHERLKESYYKVQQAFQMLN